MVKNKLKEIISERGLKQNWLAEKAGIDKTTIGNIINNKYATHVEVALKIALALNLKVEDIWYLEN